MQRLREVRERRDAKATAVALQGRGPRAGGESDGAPARFDAARADATEGEMVQALQRVFGTYSETPTF